MRVGEWDVDEDTLEEDEDADGEDDHPDCRDDPVNLGEELAVHANKNSPMGSRNVAGRAGMRRRSGSPSPLFMTSGSKTYRKYQMYTGIAILTPTVMERKIKPISPAFMP